MNGGYQHKRRFVDRSEPLVPANDYADWLRLFDHSYVCELCACLSWGGFLDYWLSHKDELTCRIGTIEPLHYRISASTVGFDDDYVQRIALITNALRPRAYDFGMSLITNAFAYLALYNQELTCSCLSRVKIRFGKFLYHCLPGQCEYMPNAYPQSL